VNKQSKHRVHVGDAKLAWLEQIEDESGQCLEDSEWNAFASLTQLQLSSVVVFLVRMLKADRAKASEHDVRACSFCKGDQNDPKGWHCKSCGAA